MLKQAHVNDCYALMPLPWPSLPVQWKRFQMQQPEAPHKTQMPHRDASQVELQGTDQPLARCRRFVVEFGAARAPRVEFDDGVNVRLLRNQHLGNVDLQRLHLAHHAELLRVARSLDLESLRLDLRLRSALGTQLGDRGVLLQSRALLLRLVDQPLLGEFGLLRAQRDVRLEPRLLHLELRLLSHALLLGRKPQVHRTLLLRLGLL
mmetsp:Transcript_26381/g.61566  ORF Transcript_26381/g.61566 Transcript_26381/m.61566 type:complete len:206 (+) Transcript_26381:331-948(+)